MRVMLVHKLAEHIPEDYVPPQKLIADVGKIVSDAGLEPEAEPQRKSPVWLHRALPLLGSNQDSPDPEFSRPGRHFRQLAGIWPLSEHRCPLPCRSLPAYARRNYGKTTVEKLRGRRGCACPSRWSMTSLCPEPFNLPSSVWGSRDREVTTVHH